MSVTAALLAIGLVAYNNAVNAWRVFHGAAYVPMNVALTAAVVAIGMQVGDLDRDTAGLRVSGWGLGLAIAGLAAAIVLALGAAPRTRNVLADPRYRTSSLPQAWYVALIRIPVGTALTEEIAFRGILYGLLLSGGSARAALVSSVAFGLWHVVPTRLLIRANRPHATSKTVFLGAIAGVALTTIAGLGFAVLREAGGGIAAPLIAHAGINSSAAVAAMILGRRKDGGSSEGLSSARGGGGD